MKKLFLILTTALFAAGFASCTDDPEETVNPSSYPKSCARSAAMCW